MTWTDRPALLRAAAGVAMLAAPIYWWQGRRLRRHLPRLAEAPGERHGYRKGDRPPYRLVGIGESPMAAVGLTRQSQGLIARTADHLGKLTGRAVEWETAARSGATASDCLNDLLPGLRLERADAVVVALGVNDCLSLRGYHRWRDDLAALIEALRRRLTPTTIVLAGVPPMQAFPALPMPLSGMLGLRAAMLDHVARELARAGSSLHHCPMVLDASHAELFCSDGFHPNATGHAQWADQLTQSLAPHVHRPS